MKNYGDRTEDLIQEICTKMFFSDFTVRRPKYKKKDGHEREAADFLIPFRDVLLAFQVKSKIETKDASQKKMVDFDRIQKRIEKGIGQFQEIKKAVIGNRIDSLRTVRGLDIPFSCSQVRKIVGVMILDLIGEERFLRDKRTAMLNGFTVEHGIPIHVFMREDFEEISRELDTLPDFLRYLDIRETLRRKDALSPFNEELDFLAIFKANWPMIDDLLKGKYDHLVLTEGIWRGYREKHDRIKERNRKNAPSYLVDEMIASFYKAIGFELEVEIPGTRKSDYSHGSVNNYLRSITELASFDRMKRRVIGEALIEKAIKAQKVGMGYRVIIDKNDKTAVLVLCFDGPRKERVNRLYKLCSVAYCKHNLKKAVGIATESMRYCQMLCFDSLASASFW